MITITGFEIRKDGYVKEDGTTIYDKQVYSSTNKNKCIMYALIHKLNPDDHFIQSIGHEIIQGIKVPASLDDAEYLNKYIKPDVSN